MNEMFTGWLQAELDTRGWNQSETARRGEFSSQMLNAVMNHQANPGLAFCRGLSRAFNMPLEEVLRRAGILPARPAAVLQVRERRRRVVYETDGDEAVLGLWRALSLDDQERVRDLMERLAPGLEGRIIGDEAGHG